MAVLLASSFTVASFGAGLVYPTSVRFETGDDPRWSDPFFDDSRWKETRLHDLPGDETLLWIRATVELSPEIAASSPLGIFFVAMASHEIYWDGELIGRGGIVGRTPSSERPGPIEAQYLVPERLATPGEHTIAIRASAFHRNFSPMNPWWALIVGDYDVLLGSRTTYTWIAMSSMSGILVGGLFALILFLADRRDSAFLVLALLCFVSAALLVAESWRSLFGYTYDLHITRLLVITALSWLLSVVLVAFMATRFPIPGRWWILGATAFALLAPLLIFRGWDGKAGGMFFIGLSVSGVWAAVAIHRRMPGSVATAFGLGAGLVALVLAPFRFADLTLFFTIDLLLICLLTSHAIRVRKERSEREEALLRSARLETELLRRQIQPHFLMNTLTALSEWIEEDPRTAIFMIESLAEELRLLSDISSKKLIPVRDELRLCRLHLDLMSSRRNRRYVLSTDGVDPDRLVPPAVFHTLVENAVTHGGRRDHNILSLHADPGGDEIRYVFEAPLDREPREEGVFVEKTGLRYIRSRLQESFGSAWSLCHGPAGGVWRTEITLPAEERV